MEVEIEKGFKHTEVGLIPEDWDCYTINEVCKLKHGFQFLEEHFSNSGVGVVKIGNLEDGKGIKQSNLTYVPKSVFQKLKNFKLVKGDVLMALTGGTLGKVAVVDTDETLLQNYRVGNFLPEENLDKKFLQQILISFYLKNAVYKLVNEAAQPNFGKQDFDKLYIPLPPTLTEQKAIATALSDVDTLITSLDQLITKKKAIKQGAMQELLTPPNKGGKRLDGFSGDWEEVRLGDFARINMGQSPLSSNYNISGNGLPLVQGNADIKNRQTIVRNYTSQITKTADEGDIIMSVRAPVGEIAISSFDCCIGRGVCSIKAKNDFLYHYLVFIEPLWSKFSTGSTFDSINSTQLKMTKLFVPKKAEEQEAIAQILSDMDAELEVLESKKEKCQQLKQGMMQELLTGKTRLV